MRVLVTGATGFVGRKLCHELLRQGHEVHILTRRLEELNFPYPCRGFTWRRGEDIDPEAFSGVEGVVHLAGASIVGRRWNSAYKKELWDSRVQGTRHLVDHIQRFGPEVKCFLAASAVGYYGVSGDKCLTEEDPVGSDFLAELCQSWEAESSRLEGVRGVTARIGLVLGKGGGLLDRLHTLFRCGLGAPLGGGKQWMSWIHIDDLVRFFCEALGSSSFEGVYNLTVPEPARNREFMDTMARTLGGFLAPPVPYMGLRLAQGEAAWYMVASQKVLPQRLLDHGFQFKYPRLDESLAPSSSR